MANKLLLSCLLFLLLAFHYSLAATIHGTVYDMELNPAENAVVKVNTVPEQTYVAKDGAYSFTVPNGKYIIEATYLSGSDKYNIQQELEIIEEGDYVLDLLLFLDISEQESLFDEDIEIPDVYPEEQRSRLWLYFIIAFIVIVGIYLILKKRKKKEPSTEKKEIEEEPETEPKPEPKPDKDELVEGLADKVLNFIKQHEGRTTQKDIRKQFPLSEAKISLVITELEAKGLVRRIKKGRGNIILLKKEETT